MSVLSRISNVRGVAADERLHNVRTRHLHLSNLFKAITENQVSLIEAATNTFQNTSRKLLQLSIDQILADIHFEADRLDQKLQNKFNTSLTKPSKPTSHVHSLPLGTVAIAAYQFDSNPIAAIFGPTVSAIASGNAVCVFIAESRFSAQVSKIFHAALDREGYVVVEESEAKVLQYYHSFDKIVTYGKDVEGLQRSSNILALPGRKPNLVVIDQSLVSESVYRIKGYQPRAKELQNLTNTVEQIKNIVEHDPSALSTVLVSENVATQFSSLLAQHNLRLGKSVPMVICRSSEHIIDELHQRNSESASLYIFAAPKHAAYLARFTKHKSCIYNSLPIEVVVAHIPTESSVQLRTIGQSVFQPFWQREIFSKKCSIISLPVSGTISRTNSNPQLQAPLTAPIMKRQKPMHMEFFPTGFKITAFPFLMSVVGVFGYHSYRVLSFAYRIGRQYVEK